MEQSTKRVLSLLQKCTKRGITVDDFPKGFRLAARIHDLRELGYVIDTQRRIAKHEIPARYLYVGYVDIS